MITFNISPEKNSISPLIELNVLPEFNHFSKKIMLKYDALNHPTIQGNKYWKLKYLVSHLIEGGYKGIVTFGGAYSNHLLACAGYCNAHKIPCNFFIRGNKPAFPGYTLRLLTEQNVELIYLDRKAYREASSGNLSSIQHLIPEGYFVLPEGGSHPVLFDGVKDFISEVRTQCDEFGISFPDQWYLPAGTGGTAAGLVRELGTKHSVFAINVLKNAGLENSITQMLSYEPIVPQAELHILDDFNFGGYAKTNRELIEFIHSFWKSSGIILDPIYTSKLLYGMVKLAEHKHLDDRNTLIWHTGGFQGIKGFNERFNYKLPEPK
jgi:1-aminocyclopropane-1-carboxylate deaminase/D-cysteine desulfhydrase-like pyridoxal-dependent ACC family enzyme